MLYLADIRLVVFSISLKFVTYLNHKIIIQVVKFVVSCILLSKLSYT